LSAADTWHDLPSGFHAQMLEGDRLVLVSTGIDIGSSTMHMAVSRLVAERDAGRFSIVTREVLYESPVVLTPYLDDGRIDSAAVSEVFEGHYRSAGIRPEQVDTGVVILTGVALDRENARSIGEMLMRWGGQFLSVAAGDRLEGVLAAHGSGAVARSRSGEPTLNVDIGGGTIKVTVCHEGRVDSVQAFDVGSRLIAWNPDTRVVERLEPAGRALASRVAVDVEIGRPFAPADEDRLTSALAESLVSMLEGADAGLIAQTVRTDSFEALGATNSIVFSGGTAEYLGGRETRDFGDLGQGLAAALRRELQRSAFTYDTSAAGIRATAIGAGQFTMQVSGITIHRSHEFPLPLRNVPVAALHPELLQGQVRADDVAHAVRARLALLDGAAEGPVALALRWTGAAIYSRLAAIATGVAAGVTELGQPDKPIILVADGDVARLLGGVLQEQLPGVPLLVIDGIRVVDLDFIDVAAPIGAHGPVPVTVKSLAFRSRRAAV